MKPRVHWCRLASAAAIALLISTFAASEGAARPGRSEAAKFGYGTMRANGKPAVGRRPLLIILGDYEDVRFHAPHTPAYYERLFFGGVRTRPKPSVNAYFSNASGGRFTFVKAGIVGPVRSFPMGSNKADERYFHCAQNPEIEVTETVAGRPVTMKRRLCPRQDKTWTWEMHMDQMIRQVARQRLFDFARYDRDRNGTITTDELTILFLSAHPNLEGGSMSDRGRFPWGCEVCGAARGRTFDLPGTRLRYSGTVVGTGESVGMATIVHELSHTLGTHDVYGANSRLNGGATLMAGTMGAPDSPHPIYLDPWHRMRLGWIEPRVFTFRQEGMAKLVAPQLGGADTRPVLLYSTSKGVHEYFLIEYRHKELGAMDRLWWSDRDKGVLVWHVRTNEHHGIFSVPAPGLPEGKIDGSLVFRGVKDRNKWAYGTGRGYFHEHGVIPLKWSNGSDTGMRLRVEKMHAKQPHAIVDWAFRREFRPTITTRSVRAAPGQRFHLDGRFGVRRDQSIQLVDRTGRKIPLPIQSWSHTRIMTRIPASVASGRYRLIAYADRSLRAHDFGIQADVTLRTAPPNVRPLPKKPVSPLPQPRLPGR